MNFEPFATGSSLFHRADGRVKLITALFLSVVISLLHHWQVALFALGFGVGMVLVAHLSLRHVVRRLLMVNIFIALLWVTLPFAGEPTLFLGPLPVNADGLALALLISLKSNAIMLVMLALIATSSIAVLGQSMQALHVPEKFCLLLLYSYRYIFVLFQEFSRLQRAAVLRGFVADTSLHTYRTYGNLFGMTLVRGWGRARRVQQAMELRGFHGRYVCLNDPLLQRGDLVLLFIGISWGLVLLVLEFSGGMM